ncbi:hypothetical protein WI36_11605 [Burkholderia ubonensis]|nr:hypothetical protein WI36_11605 [Burkholderia ubonensis]
MVEADAPRPDSAADKHYALGDVGESKILGEREWIENSSIVRDNTIASTPRCPTEFAVDKAQTRVSAVLRQ